MAVKSRKRRVIMDSSDSEEEQNEEDCTQEPSTSFSENDKGQRFKFESRKPETVRLKEKDIETAEAKGDWDQVGRLNNLIAQYYNERGPAENALQYNEREIWVSSKRTKNISDEQQAVEALAITLTNLHRHKEAIRRTKEFVKKVTAQQMTTDTRRQSAHQLGLHVVGTNLLEAAVAEEEATTDERCRESRKKALLLEAIGYFQHSLSVCDQLSSGVGLTDGEILLRKARLMQSLFSTLITLGGKDTEALNYLKSATSIANKHGDTLLQFKCHYAAADYWCRVDPMLFLAFEETSRAFFLARNLKPEDRCDCLLRLQEVYLAHKHYVIALNCLKWARECLKGTPARYEEITERMKKVGRLVQIVRRLNASVDENNEEKLRLNEKAADVLFDLQFRKLAIEYYQRGTTLCTDVVSKVALLQSIAECHHDNGDYTKAISVFEQITTMDNVPKELLCTVFIRLAETIVKHRVDAQGTERAIEFANRSISIAKEIDAQPRLKEALECKQSLAVDLLLEDEIALLDNIKANLPESQGRGEDDEMATDSLTSMDGDEFDVQDTPSVWKQLINTGEYGELKQEDLVIAGKAKATNRVEETDLHLHCRNGVLFVVRGLLEQKYNPSAQDKLGWQPIHEAAANGRADVIELLLSYGVDVDAVARGFEKGAKPGADDVPGLTPLMDCARFGHLEAMRVLLDHNASVVMHNDHGRTAVDFLLDSWEEIMEKAESDERREKLQGILREMQQRQKRDGYKKGTHTSNVFTTRPSQSNKESTNRGGHQKTAAWANVALERAKQWQRVGRPEIGRLQDSEPRPSGNDCFEDDGFLDDDLGMVASTSEQPRNADNNTDVQSPPFVNNAESSDDDVTVEFECRAPSEPRRKRAKVQTRLHPANNTAGDYSNRRGRSLTPRGSTDEYDRISQSSTPAQPATAANRPPLLLGNYTNDFIPTVPTPVFPQTSVGVTFFDGDQQIWKAKIKIHPHDQTVEAFCVYASDEYVKAKKGRRPELCLMTLEDEMELTADLSMGPFANTNLKAIVRGWTSDTLCERYERICAGLRTRPYKNFWTALAKCERGDASVLDLSDSGVSGKAAEALFRTLQLQDCVETLDVSGNAFRRRPTLESLRGLLIGADTMSTLRCLRLSNCALNGTLFAHLLTPLRRPCTEVNPLAQLKQLDLSYNNLGGEAIPLLMALLRRCPKLEQLNLTCTGLDGTSIHKEKLIEFMATEMPCLNELLIGENSLEQDGLNCFKEVGRHFWQRTHILDLSSCCRERNVISETINAIAYGTPSEQSKSGGEVSLRCLSVRDCALTAHGLSASALLRMPHLHTIDLSHNHLSNIAPLDAFLSNLQHHRALRRMDLRMNELNIGSGEEQRRLLRTIEERRRNNWEVLISDGFNGDDGNDGGGSGMTRLVAQETIDSRVFGGVC